MNSLTTIASTPRVFRPRFGMLPAALPLAILALAPPFAAQAASPGDATPAPAAATTISISSPERAAVLEARAWDLRDNLGQREQAARLYLEAANLRDDSDPIKVQSLRNASRMNFYAGQTARGVQNAAEAASLALRQGDVLVAAHSHADAAWLAAEMGDRTTAERHLADARMLASSPLLAQAQRTNLLRRISDPV